MTNEVTLTFENGTEEIEEVVTDTPEEIKKVTDYMWDNGYKLIAQGRN